MDQTLPDKVPFWLDPRKRAFFYQVFVLAAVGLLAYYLVSNTLTNLRTQNTATGFSFLERESSFEIGESLISYSAASSYGRALLVGALNTLKVSFVGVILTLVLGTILGIARLSSNWIVSRLAGIYIEVMQDIPVLLQLFFWYAIFYETFPSPRQAICPIEGLYLCNRGVAFRDRLPGPSLGKKATGKNRAIISRLSRLGRPAHRIPSDHLAGLRRSQDHGYAQTRGFQL